MDYDDKYMNILDPQGFAVAVYQVLRIKPGGSLTLAPVCGTWVWLSLSVNLMVASTISHSQKTKSSMGIYFGTNSCHQKSKGRPKDS